MLRPRRELGLVGLTIPRRAFFDISGDRRKWGVGQIQGHTSQFIACLHLAKCESSETRMCIEQLPKPNGETEPPELHPVLAWYTPNEQGLVSKDAGGVWC